MSITFSCLKHIRVSLGKDNLFIEFIHTPWPVHCGAGKPLALADCFGVKSKINIHFGIDKGKQSEFHSVIRAEDVISAALPRS